MGTSRRTDLAAVTPRSEFAVLSGLPDEALGFDRLNPYHAFARIQLPSLASRLREAGYRTVCVHPFDRRFYRRDIIMPRLGFDLFLGEEAFSGAARSGAYIADAAIADLCADILADHRGGVFIFAITMENHGPWGRAAPSDADRALAPGLEADAFAAYLRGLRSSDAMLSRLVDAFSRRGQRGVIAFYGDHLPSFPSLFQRVGFANSTSDYAIWGPRAASAGRIDLAASQLGGAVLGALRQASRRGAAVAAGSDEAQRAVTARL